ncbi:oxygen-insensitive NAD(P)H nitroreductase [Polynucleobacter sp. es-MAR-4]|uniref:oxygen-insensitive NAD(P)H nitroreductase n=1 Tax=Polynucleobacter sp. es-MAR-4 TaxID=1855655 RepID=UPI001C0E1FBE|nr:oxygen-insensitive NAD(P)H nitroreductase [Polynucleobacter sp. es-MAR-4]MBU3636064.1 oxygen-insensitive NAD(P)H nitroreductase [Polynucleobacter sp. es-MAR-4]
MKITDVAKARYTTKSFDSTLKIAPELIEQLRELLRYAPSSVNSQPWHFIIANDDAGKARIAKATSGSFSFNEAKVKNASHILVFCARKNIDEDYLETLLAQEQQDGRFPNDQTRQGQDNGRRFFVGLNRQSDAGISAWIEKQVYLALGTLLLGAGTLGIDACPMEGFDAAILDGELNLSSKNLCSVVVVALGYRASEDFNAKTPKSRLPENAIFSEI